MRPPAPAPGRQHTPGWQRALTPDCSYAWLGGGFTKVAGTPVGNVAKVRTSVGAVVTAWAHSASKLVDTVLYTPNGHVLVGGEFTSINGSGRSFYTSLNPLTGRDDGYLNLNISGHYVYPGAAPNQTQAYNQQLSPDGRHVLVEGVFTAVQGRPRQWADNPKGCNKAGPGAIPAPGMAGFTPGGSLLTNAAGTAGRYSRARGLGADDMLRTTAGLWIASDNFDGSVTCGDVTGHAGICFLPNS